MKKWITGGRVFCLCAAVLLVALAALAYVGDAKVTPTSDMLIAKHEKGVGMLTEEAVGQTFIAEDDHLCQIDVMVSNYNKKVKSGTLTLTLLDSFGKQVAQQTWEASKLKNNAFITMEIPDQGSSRGKQYTLTATSDCTEQKGITLRMGPGEKEGAELRLADGTVDAENDLNLRLCYQKKTYGWMAGMTLLLPALCFAACVPLAGRKEKRA